MPLYEYLCEACHQRSEILQRFSDPPATVCPNCGGALKKLLSAPAFQFKGTGWYVSDYAKKSGGSDGESSKKESTATSSVSGEASGSSASGGSSESGGASSAAAASSSAASATATKSETSAPAAAPTVKAKE